MKIPAADDDGQLRRQALATSTHCDAMFSSSVCLKSKSPPRCKTLPPLIFSSNPFCISAHPWSGIIAIIGLGSWHRQQAASGTMPGGTLAA